MARRVVSKGTGRSTATGQGSTVAASLDDRPLFLRLSADHKRLIVVLPYEVWILHAGSLDIEKAIELPFASPSVFEGDDEGTLWIGGQHLRKGSLFASATTKVGTKLGGVVDWICLVRPRLLCGVGPQGEVLWNSERESEDHRRKTSEHLVYGLVASPDGRAVWADGSPHAWVIDPDHASGYMKLKLRRSSPASVESEGIVALGTSIDGRTLLAARDGAVAWSNRALRIVGERFPRLDGLATPLAIAADAQWVYVLRPGAVLQRFLIEQPEPDNQDPEAQLPEAQTARLSRLATCIAAGPDGSLYLAGPQSDDQLGRLWREDPNEIAWEVLRLGQRPLVDEPPESAEAEPPKKPDFTPIRSKLRAAPISDLKVDDVLSGTPPFWVTRDHGTILERRTDILEPADVLPGDAILLPAMFRLQGGVARPGLVVWPGAPDDRELPPIEWLTWGDKPRGWLPLQTPALREQGWPRREVFPLQLALAHPPPTVAGQRPKIPRKWDDRELFDALARECKKLLKVLW